MASTKDTIVQLGDELMRMKGYNAFSYADISKQIGIKNAAVHYHFPTKPDLAKAIVEWHMEHFDRFAEKAASRNEADQVKMFLNFYTSIQVSGKLCLIGSFATDWNSMEAEVQKEVKKFTDKVLDWLTSTLDKGKDASLLKFNGSARTEALKIITNMFAGTQLARITGSEDFASIKDSILNNLTK
jgi:AcrR family transcriptional regulator